MNQSHGDTYIISKYYIDEQRGPAVMTDDFSRNPDQGLQTMRCEDCEHLDDLIFETTKIWFHLPTGESYAKLAGLCGRQGIAAEPLSDRSIAISVPGATCHAFAVALYGAMPQHELRNVRVVTTNGSDPTAMDLGRVVSADVFVNRIKGQWIIDRVREGHIETWYQPILTTGGGANTGRPETFGMEALLRVRNQAGNMIPPEFVFQVARDADVLFSVDLMARASGVETAAKAGYRGKIFVNFNPSSVYDPAYCLRTTVAAISALGLKPSDIVFEITETEKITDIDHLKGILAFYRRAGFSCALDDIGSGWSGLNLLHTFRPDYVKLDMDLIRDADTDLFKQSIVRNLINIAKDQQISVIAEGIETEGEARFAAEVGADYVQGFYYAKPRPIAEFL